jgi:cytochrome c-type biogenesis protein CcmF
MGEQLPGGEWVVRVQYKPFIIWTWGGCLLMMAGGILAASDRRYRVRKSAVSKASSHTAEAAA